MYPFSFLIDAYRHFTVRQDIFSKFCSNLQCLERLLHTLEIAVIFNVCNFQFYGIEIKLNVKFKEILFKTKVKEFENQPFQLRPEPLPASLLHLPPLLPPFPTILALARPPAFHCKQKKMKISSAFVWFDISAYCRQASCKALYCLVLYSKPLQYNHMYCALLMPLTVVQYSVLRIFAVLRTTVMQSSVLIQCTAINYR